nr:hypothetical protein [Lysinibacillus sphaericus]
MTNTQYFLCTGNSCRSQMADGRKLLPSNWTVKSAGIKAHGVNPKACNFPLINQFSPQSSKILLR